MSTLPRFGVTELVTGQDVPETTVNENLRYVAQGAGHFIFNDRNLATPPGSPADGDCYLVAASATGDWSGQDGNIAFYLSTAWVFITPIEGFSAWVSDEDTLIAYDGTSWANVNSGALAAADTDIWTGTDTSKRVTPKSLYDAAAFQTLTDGATITPDFGAGLNFKVTLAGNRTLANPSNAKEGQSGVIRVIQDASGSRTLSYGSNWRFPGGASTGGVLSTAASSIDLIAYVVDESGLIYATLNKAFAA